MLGFPWGLQEGCLVQCSDETFIVESNDGQLVDDDLIYDNAREAVIGCNVKTKTSISIPVGPTTVATQAFSGFRNLESVNMSDTVLEIGTSAFAKCEKLKSVEFGNGVETIGYGAFAYCSSIE